jgi:dihydroxy-acid dehydratase
MTPGTPRELRSNYEPGTSRWATRRAQWLALGLSGLVNKGIVVGEISPEAAAGGPIGLVRDGDVIRIDVPARTADLEVPADELAERKRALTAAPRGRPVEVGWLSVYQRLVRPLPEGAVLRPRREA